MPAALWELTAARRYIIDLHRACLENRQPIGALRDSTENNGIFFRIEFRNEMIAGLGWGEGGRHRQSSLGIESQDHRGIIPPGVDVPSKTHLESHGCAPEMRPPGDPIT